MAFHISVDPITLGALTKELFTKAGSGDETVHDFFSRRTSSEVCLFSDPLPSFFATSFGISGFDDLYPFMSVALIYCYLV